MAARRRLAILLLLLLAIALVAVGWMFLGGGPPPRAFINGKVLTMNPADDIAEAVLLEEGRIAAVGSTDEIRALAVEGTEITDLNGRVLMPGIIDAHGHFPGSGIYAVRADLNSPPIGDIENMAQLVTRLQGHAAQREPGEWIFALGYDDTLLQEKRHPSRYDLDQVSSEHPILIMHVSGHLGVANSLALEMVGFDSDSLNPEGGVIVKDPVTGEPTGLLEENAMLPVSSLAGKMALADTLSTVRHAIREYARMGVTTAQSGGVDPQIYSGLRWFSRLGLLKSRLVVFPAEETMGSALLADLEKYTAHNTEFFTVGPVKIMADGSIQGYTGYLSQPYHQPFHGDREYRGYPRMSLEQLSRRVARYHRRGVQMAIHGNGDAAIDDIIQAFEDAQRVTPDPDPRLILIHAQMARADQLDAFKRLGITPSFFSAHTYYWGDRHRDIFMGPGRAAQMSPARWAVERELPFTIHLDTPVVPMQPFLLVWSAVNRISFGGHDIGPQQRISALQALRATTIDAAWQVFEEDNRGSIEVGKWADLIVLSADPLADPMSIKDIEVLETVVGGKTVFPEL